jgi:hypothetical protein
MCDKYSGWANRETWALQLWLSNDQGLYEMTRERVYEAVAGSAGRRPGLAGIAVKAFWEALTDPDEGLMSAEAILPMIREVGSAWRIDWDVVTARIGQRTALVLALSILLYVGLFCDPIQFWLADLQTGLSSGPVAEATTPTQLAPLPPYWHRQAPAGCTEDSRCWIGSVNDSRTDAASLDDWMNR